MIKKIKTFTLLLPIILSFLMISAHFYRAGNTVIAVTSLFIPFLLLIKKHYTAKIIQLMLLISSMEWLRTIYQITSIRIKFQMPWLRFTFIMSFVFLLTFLSVFIFKLKPIKKIYFKEK